MAKNKLKIRFGFLWIPFIILAVLKITKVINISWWVVTFPLWGFLITGLFVLYLILFVWE
jgi:hypothetical protein